MTTQHCTKTLPSFIFLILLFAYTSNAQLTANNCTYVDKYGYYYDLTQLTNQDWYIFPVESSWASQWNLTYAVCGISNFCSSKFQDAQACQSWVPNPIKYMGLSGLASTQTFETLSSSGEGIILSSKTNPKSTGGCQEGSQLNIQFLCSESSPVKVPSAVENPQCIYTLQVPTSAACPFGGNNVRPILGVVSITCQESATGQTIDSKPFKSYECTVENTSNEYQEVALYSGSDDHLSKVWGQFRPSNTQTGKGIWYPKNGISPMKPGSFASFGYMTFSKKQLGFLPITFK